MNNYSIETQGVVTKVLPNTIFRIQVDDGTEVLGNLSHKMKKNYTRILVGDRVKIALTSYQARQGCITQRFPE
ncbi:MAG: translation initiation factor IF-1 [Leptolyngbya sp. SIO1D8]|nr:translation initiation factor IF-1 [Leptolyngbya sp. SIO1D8]